MKPETNSTVAEVPVDDGWVDEWVAFGFREMYAYLAHHLAFAIWCDEHDASWSSFHKGGTR